MKIQIVEYSKDAKHRDELKVLKEIEDETLDRAKRECDQILYDVVYKVHGSFLTAPRVSLFLPDIKPEPISLALPGDVVQVVEDYVGVSENAKGVVEGVLGQRRERYTVCFNASAFRDDSVVSCSGGPGFYLEATSLAPARETVLRPFWRWRRDLPGGGQGASYLAEVNLWWWSPDL